MSNTKHKKHEIDATGERPGRLATRIATLLMGKHKVSYDPHLDAGDRVTIINADKIVFSGKKLAQKEYLHHTMHPGGLKSLPASKLVKEDPERVIRLAVAKMLPKNKLRVGRMKRLLFK